MMRGEKSFVSIKSLMPHGQNDIVAAEIDDIVYHLEAEVDKNSTIKWIMLNSEAGVRIYERTLCLILFVALAEAVPGMEIQILFSISNGFYCESLKGKEFSKDELSLIQRKMKEIIDENVYIQRHKVNRSEAIDYFQAKGRSGTINLIKQQPEDEVVLYSCNGVTEYIYDIVADYTGKAHSFEIQPYLDGFLVRFPSIYSKELTGSDIPPFIPQDKLAKSFLEAESWADILGCKFISDLNQLNSSDQFDELVQLSEAFHTRKLIYIADGIAEHRKEQRLICIAGPSSSGKTTFAGRLRKYLQINRIHPVMISVDDYFKNREDTPKKPDGSYDFEHIETIDLELFNEHLDQLLHGEEVEIPSFNFISGRREWSGHRIKVNENEPIIIEGIHCLNEKLTHKVPRNEKIKIYISALTQLALDHHNRISTTETRLIRRLVRDFQFRGASAEQTLGMWRSIREGEERFIFPFQEEADVMFNSTLLYELPILKRRAEPLLKSVPRESDLYGEAQKLLQFLSYFLVADCKAIPEESLLKEFIGTKNYF